MDLGNAQEGSGAAVATDTNGDSVAAWLQEAPVSGQLVFDIEVDYRPAGGEFSESTVATIAGSSYATVAPLVWFLPDGTAVVAWGGDENGHQPAIADSVRPPGGDSQFGAANWYLLPSDAQPAGAYRAFQIAAGGGDSATLLWQNVQTDWLSGDEYVEHDSLMIGRVDAQGAITATPVPGATAQQHVVGTSHSGTRMMTYALAGDGAGDRAVVWGVMPAGSSTARGTVYGSYASRGQPLQSTPDVIGAHAYVGEPIVGSMLASGTAVFASEWASRGAQYVERTKSAARFPATLTNLPGVSDANDPQLVAGDGQTIVEYTGHRGQALYSAIAPDGGQFGSPTLLADTGEASLALAGDGNGNAITVFNEGSTSSAEVELMTDTFTAQTTSAGSGTGSAPGGTAPPSPPAFPETTAASSLGPPAAAAPGDGGARRPATTNLKRLALDLAAAIARFAHDPERATIPARCVGASAQTCFFSGRLFAARWQPRNQAWVKTRIQLGAVAGLLRGSRLGQLTIKLSRAGLIALRHSRVVSAWLSGTLRSSGQRISVGVPIRVERRRAAAGRRS